jgi:hypothetical protein
MTVYVVQKHYSREGSDILGVFAVREDAEGRALLEQAENNVPDWFTVTEYATDGSEGTEIVHLEGRV